MRPYVWWIALLLILAGCQSTTFSADCNNRTDNNVSRCKINFSELSGRWSRDVNVSYIAESAEALPLTVSASVGQGTVRVSYVNDQGDTVSHEVSHDTPLDIMDTIQISGDQAHVEFMSLDMTATDVQAVVEVGPGPE